MLCAGYVVPSFLAILFLSVIGKMWTNIIMFIMPCVFLVCQINDPILGLICFCLLSAELRIWTNFCFSCLVSSLHSTCTLLILLLALSTVFAIFFYSCKGPAHGCLIGVVSYRVPLAPRQSIIIITYTS